MSEHMTVESVRAAIVAIAVATGNAGHALAGTVTWDGGGDGTSWHDELNWSGDQLPGPADDVIIDVVGDITVVHSTGDDVINSLMSEEAVTLSGGSLSIAAASAINNAFTQSNGTLDGAGDLTVTGPLTWTRGLMTGTGKTIADGTLELSGTSFKDLRRDLDNNGMATWQGIGRLHINSAAVFTNMPGAVFEAQNDVLIRWLVGLIGTFDNRGIFRKTAGAGVTESRVSFVDSGEVDVQTGTVRFRADSSHTGVLTGAGTVEFIGNGTHILDGVVVTAADVLVSGGTLELRSDVTIPSYTQTNGTLDGAGDLIVTGPLTWMGGSMWGTGMTIVDGTLDMDGNGPKELRRNLNNNGIATWQGNGSLQLNTGAVFTNMQGAVFEAQNDVLMRSTVGTIGTFDNRGIFRKTPGEGVTESRVNFVNSGEVDVQTGTVLFREDSSHTGVLTGAGTVEFAASGLHILDGVVVTTADVLVSGGTVELTSDLTLSSYSQSDGTLNGAGDLIVTVLLTWTGGAMGGTGKTIVNDTLDMDGNGFKELRRDLDNHGMATWRGTGRMDINDAVFMNMPGAVFEVHNDEVMWWQATAGSFDNRGTFRKTPGVDRTLVRINFTNRGRVEALTGTLEFRDIHYIQTDGATIVEATLEALAPSVVELQGGSLHSDGLITGVVMNENATVEPGLSPGLAGLATIDGDYAQATPANMRVELGGLIAGDEHDQTVVSGTAALAGVLEIVLIDKFVPQGGDSFVILTAGEITGRFECPDFPMLPDGFLWMLIESDRVTLLVRAERQFDLNYDGVVSFADILLLLASWGPCPPDCCPPDFNGNGEVDFGDLLVLLSNWG